ncbi:MAG: LCP family protein [Bifidobacterium sp.]|nr:LCP family protein [Bifidobacterium sp.]
MPLHFAPLGRRHDSKTKTENSANNAASRGENNGQAIPRSFPPSRRSSSAPASGSADFASEPHAARRSSGSSNHTGGRAGVYPHYTAPGASGSASSSPRQNRLPAAAPTVRRPASSAQTRRAGVSPSTAAVPRRHHHRILMAFLVLFALLFALLLGAWMWVDSQLDKHDWITSHTDTIGTSWLILGSDKRDGTTSNDGTIGFRTDTILVLTKPNHGPSSLISIPRDSLVKANGKSMKINAVAQLAGEKQLVAQVETITGHNIDHVAQIQFGGLKGLVDAVGGVQLCYDRTVNDEKSLLNWTAGCHLADGDTALAFSRMRYSDPQGDFGRAARQRQVIGAIMSKASSRAVLTSPGTVKKVASAALDSISVDEDTSPATLLSMAKAFRAATGNGGVTGSVYWTNPGYYVSGVGSSVLLDETKNLALFDQLANGTHAPGAVGTLADTAK